MSILIKGMEMPDSCHVCVAGYGGCCYAAPPESDGICPDHGKADWCPLIEIPPHGRLIDADAFVKDECNNCDGACEALPCDCLNCESDCRCDFMQDIANTPTVIPADPEKDGEP